MNGFERVHECVGSWTDAGQWQIVPDEPIVRCKDCRHAYEHADARGSWLLCDLSTYFEVKPNGFCAWGEKKEGESDE